MLKNATLSVVVLVLVAAVTPAADTNSGTRSGPVINEWVSDHSGADTNEFIEVFGTPNSNTSWATLVVVSGNTETMGEIDASFTVGTLNGGGYWDTGAQTNILVGSVTLLLVSGYTGGESDLDLNDDGTFDVDPLPWSDLLDSISVIDGDPGDVAYSASAVGAGGASRIPNGTDTDTTTDWLINDFEGQGLLDGISGTAGLGEAINTPSWPNQMSRSEYYKGVDASSSTTLRTTLHETIDDHIRYDYTDDAWDTWDMVNSAEEFTPGGPGVGEILDLYRNEIYTKIPGGQGIYNREHSWPNTYGFSDNNSGNYPYTDAHHLFACNANYNSDRSSRPFRTCDLSCTEKATVFNNNQGGGTGVHPGNSNWFDGAVTGGMDGRWETWIGRRGDVARAQLYMDVRYEGGVHGQTGATEPDLILTDNLALITSGAPYMGELATILQWHKDDPVDDLERRRSGVISSFQTNRNPFVDDPEWVECLFENVCNVFTDGFESGTTSAWSFTAP